MTKITSIEERVEKLLENETDEAMDFFPTAPVVAKQTVVLILTQALTAQRTALLTELRKVLASEGVLSMSVEKALVEIIT